MKINFGLTDLLLKLFVKNHGDTDDPEVRKSFGMLSGIVGILCNVVLFAAKLFAGTITSSIAISADAFNNLSDAGASLVTLACFKMAGAPADKEHPFGHGRIEYVSGLIISVAIIITGISFIKSSVEKIFYPDPVSFNSTSALILTLSLLLKLWMGLFNAKLGKIVNSHAVKAASIDSLADVAITTAVIIGMVVTRFTGVCVDAYAGIIVAVFILLTGVSMIKETLNPLLGQAPSSELVKEINETVSSHPEVLGIHELMVHNYGPGRSVISLHAEMPADVDILILHDVVDEIEKELKSKFNCQAVIHLDPVITNDEAVNEVRTKLSELVKLVHPEASVYDLRIVPGGAVSTLVFDLLIPYNLDKSDEDIVSSLKRGVKIIDESYECIISVKRDYLEP